MNNNLILVFIFILFAYLLFQIINIKNSENFANLNNTAQITVEVIDQISNLYQADVQAIRNLAIIAKALNTGNNTVIPGTLSISGQLNVDTINVNSNLTISGNINGLNLQNMNDSLKKLADTQNTIISMLNIQGSQQVYNSQASLVANSQASQNAASQLIANSQASTQALNSANLQASLTANLKNTINSQLVQNNSLQNNVIYGGSQIYNLQGAVASQLTQNSNLQGAMNSQIIKDTGIQNNMNSQILQDTNIQNSQQLQISAQQGIINSETAQINNQQAIMNSQASTNAINANYILNQFAGANIYFVPSLSGLATNRTNGLPNKSIFGGPNNILSFYMDYSGATWGDWSQVFGITNRSNGDDYRYLSLWLCPSSNTMHLRTYTQGNGNNDVWANPNEWCYNALSAGTHRIDIISNTINGSQTFTVYDNGNLIKTTTLPLQDNPNQQLYIYSSYGYKNYTDVNPGNRVYNMLFMTSNNNFDVKNSINLLNSYYQVTNPKNIISNSNLTKVFNTQNVYFVPAVYGSVTNLLPNTTINPGPNNILSFYINYSGITSGNWTQIIGITTRSNGDDQRYFAIWFCPNSTNLYIRTNTTSSGDDDITSCVYSLTPGIHRIDIISNTQNNYQYFTVYDNGNLVTNRKQMSLQAYNNNYNFPLYIYSSFTWIPTILSQVSSNVYNLLFVTSNNNFDERTTLTQLNTFYANLVK